MTLEVRTSKEQFDRQAAHYDAQWNTWSAETLAWLLAAADPQLSDTVLDVATGGGFTAIAFAEKAKSVVGSDVSTGMIEQATARAAGENRHNVSFVEAPAEDMPFDDSTFDIVTCRVAPHHFVDIAEFASECFRVLKPDGCLVIADTSVPDDDFLAAIWQNEVERLRDPSHARNYTMNEWRKILTKAGFKIESITDTGSGICIPLTSWIYKAGCSPEQEEMVRGRFNDAPLNVRKKYSIETDDQGEVWFTWMRVLIKAVKPTGRTQ